MNLDYTNETRFQRDIEKAARDMGWQTFHPKISQGSSSGWPDLVLVHPTHGILFRELKIGDKQPTVAQRNWLACLESAGGDARVWRPSDMDLIMAELIGRKPQRENER